MLFVVSLFVVLDGTMLFFLISVKEFSLHLEDTYYLIFVPVVGFHAIACCNLLRNSCLN